MPLWRQRVSSDEAAHYAEQNGSTCIPSREPPSRAGAYVGDQAAAEESAVAGGLAESGKEDRRSSRAEWSPQGSSMTAQGRVEGPTLFSNTVCTNLTLRMRNIATLPVADFPYYYLTAIQH